MYGIDLPIGTKFRLTSASDGVPTLNLVVVQDRSKYGIPCNKCALVKRGCVYACQTPENSENSIRLCCGHFSRADGKNVVFKEIDSDECDIRT